MFNNLDNFCQFFLLFWQFLTILTIFNNFDEFWQFWPSLQFFTILKNWWTIHASILTINAFTINKRKDKPGDLYKAYIFCEDMILATCQCLHIFCCWVEPSLLLSIYFCLWLVELSWSFKILGTYKWKSVDQINS